MALIRSQRARRRRSSRVGERSTDDRRWIQQRQWHASSSQSESAVVMTACESGAVPGSCRDSSSICKGSREVPSPALVGAARVLAMREEMQLCDEWQPGYNSMRI